MSSERGPQGEIVPTVVRLVSVVTLAAFSLLGLGTSAITGIASMVGFMSGSLIATALSTTVVTPDPDPTYAPRRNPVAIAPLASTSHLGVSLGGTF